MKTYSPRNIQILASLGITYGQEVDQSSSPEALICELLNDSEFIGGANYGFLKLVFANLHDLILVDKLSKESRKITSLGRATLSSICLFVLKEIGDERYMDFDYYRLPEPYNNSLTPLNKIKGRIFDPNLIEYNIYTREFGIQPQKKIMEREELLSKLKWFKERSLSSK